MRAVALLALVACSSDNGNMFGNDSGKEDGGGDPLGDASFNSDSGGSMFVPGPNCAAAGMHTLCEDFDGPALNGWQLNADAVQDTMTFSSAPDTPPSSRTRASTLPSVSRFATCCNQPERAGRISRCSEHSTLTTRRQAPSIANMDVRVAKCVLLTKVLAADGMITENERRLLDKAMARAGLDDKEKIVVLDPEHWHDAEAAVAKLAEDERRDLVGELVEAATADGRLSPLENAMLKQITAALGL